MTIQTAPIANVVLEPRSRGMIGAIERAGRSPALLSFVSPPWNRKLIVRSDGRGSGQMVGNPSVTGLWKGCP
jgi:hypothetical protein